MDLVSLEDLLRREHLTSDVVIHFQQRAVTHEQQLIGIELDSNTGPMVLNRAESHGKSLQYSCNASAVCGRRACSGEVQR